MRRPIADSIRPDQGLRRAGRRASGKAPIVTRSAALVAFLAVAASPALADAPPPPAITVSGEGLSAAAPDIAILTSAVVSAAPTASAALKANAAAMTKVLAAAKQAGVADRDVGTTGLTVQPQYDYGSGGSNARAPKLVGYEARNALAIRSRAVEKLGELIDALVQAGSNQIENLAFDIAEKDARLDDARRAAMKDARRKAELYAQSAGVKLGPLLALDEDASGAEPSQPFAGRMKAMDAAPATPIARGEQELRVRVTAKWGIEP